MQRGSVLSAYCKCEGGRDSGCKHIAAAMYYTVEPLLSGHPRGMARWPLNRGGRLIEVCQIWTRVWSTTHV